MTVAPLVGGGQLLQGVGLAGGPGGGVVGVALLGGGGAAGAVVGDGGAVPRCLAVGVVLVGLPIGGGPAAGVGGGAGGSGVAAADVWDRGGGCAGRPGRVGPSGGQSAQGVVAEALQVGGGAAVLDVLPRRDVAGLVPVGGGVVEVAGAVLRVEDLLGAASGDSVVVGGLGELVGHVTDVGPSVLAQVVADHGGEVVTRAGDAAERAAFGVTEQDVLGRQAAVRAVVHLVQRAGVLLVEVVDVVRPGQVALCGRNGDLVTGRLAPSAV